MLGPVESLKAGKWKYSIINRDSGLSPIGVRVGLVLGVYMDPDGSAGYRRGKPGPSMKKLAEGARTSLSKVSEGLGELDDAGYLAIERGQGRRSNRYQATAPLNVTNVGNRNRPARRTESNNAMEVHRGTKSAPTDTESAGSDSASSRQPPVPPYNYPHRSEDERRIKEEARRIANEESAKGTNIRDRPAYEQSIERRLASEGWTQQRSEFTTAGQGSRPDPSECLHDDRPELWGVVNGVLICKRCLVEMDSP